MKIFVDISDTQTLSNMISSGMIDGFTTNPNIIRKFDGKSKNYEKSIGQFFYSFVSKLLHKENNKKNMKNKIYMHFEPVGNSIEEILNSVRKIKTEIQENIKLIAQLPVQKNFIDHSYACLIGLPNPADFPIVNSDSVFKQDELLALRFKTRTVYDENEGDCFDFQLQICIKIPVSHELSTLALAIKEIIPCAMINATLCFSLLQATLAARIGIEFVSLFMGRIDDMGVDSSLILSEILDTYKKYNLETMIIAASIRNKMHCHNAIKLGTHSITASAQIIDSMYHHPLTTSGIDEFNKSWI